MNFPSQKRTCPECPEFPVMQDRKTAKAGKNALGPVGEKKEKSSSFGKKRFFGWKKQNVVGWKKTCRVKKKSVGWRISPVKNGHVRNVRNSL